MRLVPFAVGAEKSCPKQQLLCATGVAWGCPRDDAPRGRVGLWLWRSNALHRRTRRSDGTFIEHYRFTRYGLEFELGRRRRYLRLA